MTGRTYLQFKTSVAVKERIDTEAEQRANRGAKLRNKITARSEWEDCSNKTQMLAQQTDKIYAIATKIKRH